MTNSTNKLEAGEGQGPGVKEVDQVIGVWLLVARLSVAADVSGSSGK